MPQPLCIRAGVGSERRHALAQDKQRPHSHRVLHDLRVDPRYAVDGMGADHTQVGHINPLAFPFLNHRHPPQAVHIPREQGSHLLLPRQRGMSRSVGVSQWSGLPERSLFSSKEILGLLHPTCTHMPCSLLGAHPPTLHHPGEAQEDLAERQDQRTSGAKPCHVTLFVPLPFLQVTKTIWTLFPNHPNCCYIISGITRMDT